MISYSLVILITMLFSGYGIWWTHIHNLAYIAAFSGNMPELTAVGFGTFQLVWNGIGTAFMWWNFIKHQDHSERYLISWQDGKVIHPLFLLSKILWV